MNIGSYGAYISAETMMGPNSVRILAELFDKYPVQFAPDDKILDLGCGTGLTSLVIAKETGTRVFANDLWVSAEENGRRFFLLFLKPIINGVGNYYVEARTRDMRRMAGDKVIVEAVV